MLKNWLHDIALSVQAKSGVTPLLFAWFAIVALALLTGFAFLCVAGYTWLSLQLGAVFAGLAMAGIFLVIALIVATAAAVSRRSARQRAILERAARAQGLLIVAARPQNVECRHAGRPLARLGAHHPGRALGLSRRAVAARKPTPLRRQRELNLITAHSRASGNPGAAPKCWVPAFAGTSGMRVPDPSRSDFGLIRRPGSAERHSGRG